MLPLQTGDRMSFPLNPEELVTGNVIESTRIEYKGDWNPEPIMHTICAFANDIQNLNGGYIVIGVEEKNGVPNRPVKGVNKDSVDGILKEAMNLCSSITPRYIPESETFTVDEKTLIALWVPGGPLRPYKCPISLSKKREDRGYFIRKLNSTIRASPSEEKELFSVSENRPFDDRINESAKLSDLSLPLINEYLGNIGSPLTSAVFQMPQETVLSKMHLVDGPLEKLQPLNSALMFFNPHPEDFFREAKIIITIKNDPTGQDMIERTITGPLDHQIRSAISYIQNSVLEERIIKADDRPESERIWNYPLKAVEEAVSNAVYHKNYEIPEPITVVVSRTQIEVTSIPGPDWSITDEDMAKGVFHCRRYRNRRIGDYLKSLRLAEAMNTGIPTMIDSMRNNGSPDPVFRTDSTRSYFSVFLPIHEAFISLAGRTGIAPPASDNGHKRTRQEIVDEVIGLLSKNGEMSITEISDRMGYRTKPTSLKAAIGALISEGTLEYTMPDLRSSKQKVRLTGRAKKD